MPEGTGTAPAEGALREKVSQPLRSVTRTLAAVVVGGAIAALGWLVVVQESAKRGYTDLDVNHALGELWRGPVDTGRVRSDEALGVIGDPVAPTGFRLTVLAGVALVALYALVGRRLPLRRWYLRALPLAAVVFLLAALVYAPLVSDHGVAAAGPFGLDAGVGTPFVFAAGALAAALIGVRVYELMSGTRWWEPKDEGMGVASLAAVETAAAARRESSLELAEEGSEERRVGPGA